MVIPMNHNTAADTSTLTDYERLLRLEEIVSELSQKLDDIFDAIQLELAADRRRISALENKFDRTRSSSLFEQRREVAITLLAANGGKMLQKDLQKRMELSKSVVSELLRTLETEKRIMKKRLHSNNKENVIILLDGSREP
jgi:Uncharacterized membrane-associated protein/domain